MSITSKLNPPAITSKFQPPLNDLALTLCEQLGKCTHGIVHNQWQIEETFYSLIENTDNNTWFVLTWGDGFQNIKYSPAADQISLQRLLQLTGIKAAATLEKLAHEMKLPILTNKKGNFAALTGADTHKLLLSFDVSKFGRGRKPVTNVMVIILPKGHTFTDAHKQTILSIAGSRCMLWSEFSEYRKMNAKKRKPKNSKNSDTDTTV